VTNPHDRARVLLGMPPEALLFQRFAHPLRNHGGIVGESKYHATLESLRACDPDAEATLNGSPAIHASCGPGARRPPAVTAASMRSRRLPDAPFEVEDGERHGSLGPEVPSMSAKVSVSITSAQCKGAENSPERPRNKSTHYGLCPHLRS
jgi:hypothetical protein